MGTYTLLKGANISMNTMYRSMDMYSNPATRPIFLIVLIEFSFFIAPIVFPLQCAGLSVLFEIRPICLAGLGMRDRDEGQAQIPHFSQQPVERRLIHHRAGQQRVAVVFQRDG